VHELRRWAESRLARTLFDGRLAIAPLVPAEASVTEDNPAVRVLGAAPSVAVAWDAVRRAVSSPLSDARRVAAALAGRPGLERLVLAMARGLGPAGREGRDAGASSVLASVIRAVALCGFNDISALALASDLAPGARTHGGDEGLLWLRSMVRGLLARRVGLLAGRRMERGGEWLFASGLLLEAGALLAGRGAPVSMARAANLAAAENIAPADAEASVFGAHLGELGGMAMGRLGAPARLEQLLRLGPVPGAAPDDPGALALHVADVLARAACLPMDPAARVPALRPGSLEALGIDMATLLPEAEAAHAHAAGLAHLLRGFPAH
jgi:hypothetical protein